MTTARDVENEILNQAGLQRQDITRLPVLTELYDGGGRFWQITRPHPSNPSMRVHSMYRSEAEEHHAPGDARIYVIPTDDRNSCGRYVVNPHFPGFTSESMSDETFIAEVAGELQSLALANGFEECPSEKCSALVAEDAEACPRCKEPLVEDEPANGPAAGETLPAPPVTSSM